MTTPSTNAQTIKLLWYNTFLLHGLSIGPMRQFGAKPHLTDRAHELGTRLQKLVDSAATDSSDGARTIFALCEVFSPKTFALIYEQLNPQNTRYASGPKAGLDPLLAIHGAASVSRHLPHWMLNIVKAARGELPVSSGLYTLTSGLKITRTVAEPFRLISKELPEQPLRQFTDWNLLNRGHPLRDPDFWANKGILLTEIDLGPGKIELYSTHLFSGQVFGEAMIITLRRLQKLQLSGVLPFPIPFKRPLQALLRSSFAKKLSEHFEKYQQFFDLRPPQRLQIQRGQLQQLVDFIVQHHHPENVVILTGDFNLDANDPLSLALLSQAIDKLKEHGIRLQDTRHEFQRKTHTHTTMIPNELLFHTYQPEQLEQAAHAAAIQSATSPGDVPHQQWLDYIFVQKEEAQHSCSINVIDQALRPFARPSTRHQTMHFLSDHIGLEISLRASPRPS